MMDKVTVLIKINGISYNRYFYLLSCNHSFEWYTRYPPTYCPFCGKEIE